GRRLEASRRRPLLKSGRFGSTIRPRRRVDQRPACEVRDPSRHPRTRTSKAKGHWQVCTSRAAFRFEVPTRAPCRGCRNFNSAAQAGPPRTGNGVVPFRISGKNIDIGEALRARVNARIAEAMGKYFDGGYSGHVTVGKEGFGFRTECALHLDSGITLQAEGMAADAYASADHAAIRIANRRPRSHRRLKGRPVARTDGISGAVVPPVEAPSYVIAAPEHESDEEPDEFNPVIIAESTTALKQLSVSEAVMELDMTGAQIVVFRHAGHGRLNLVYRRADGHIGWIDPPPLNDAHN